MSDTFVGQLALVPYNFAPAGWALCNGQLLSIAQNAALFSLIGTTFGGDGESTFALPDLRGRVPISSGQAPGLENYPLGQKGGTERTTLTEAHLPAHTHTLNVHNGGSDKTTPTGNFLANGWIYNDGPANGAAAVSAIASTGSGQAHDNRQPYLTLNWIISLFGVFPQH